MAMSRSLGGTSLTFSVPMKMSPPEASSSPAIMRSVVLLPQPDGPTSTRNSLSGISRLTFRTASTSSYFFETLRSATSAMFDSTPPAIVATRLRPRLSRGCAGGQAGDVVVHQKSVDEQRRRRGEQRAGHQHAPLVDVGADQAGHGADGEHLLVRAVEECQRIDERRPGDRE